MRAVAEDVHTFMGIRKGKAFAGWCMGRSGRQIQGLLHPRLRDVIKFAYGSAAFFDDCIDPSTASAGRASAFDAY